MLALIEPSRRLLAGRFADPANFTVDRRRDPLGCMQALRNLANMLWGHPKLPSNPAEQAVVPRSLYQLGRDTFKVVGQVEPLDYASKHMPARIFTSRGFRVSLEKKENAHFVKQIVGLRERLGMRQVAFAERLGVDQGTVSKWERGKTRPTSEAFVRLAGLAQGVEKLFFLEEAGLPEEFLDGKPMLPELRDAAAATVADALARDSGEIVEIPLLRDPVAAGNPRAINERDIQARVPFLRRWLPRGGKLFAFRVTGDSMAPIVNEGYTVIIDAEQRDPKHLVGQMVAAREDDGVTIKWLRKDKDIYLLVPQHVSIRIPVRIMRPSEDWGIVGVVVKWVGSPPPPG
ncbi:MAG TPA: S24 family peptidase, partial [Terracidiphilus sp.]